MTEVRIPGKVMLSGEYAVLFGGTAVLIPVERWMTVRPSSGEPGEVLSHVLRLALELPLPETAEFERSNPLELPVLDSSEFYAKTRSGMIKLGLGASAAEAVAAVAFRLELAGMAWEDHKELVFKYAYLAHQRAQSGLGSGADVAACCYGVPLFYRLEGGSPAIERVTLPSRSRHSAALAWTGMQADTRSHVERFQSWADSGGKHATQLLNRLVQAADAVAGEWFKASWDDLYLALTDFIVLLNRCTTEAGVPYKSEPHRAIETWALRHGGKAKPVGAGGGDMTLLLGDLPFDELEGPVIRLTI